MIYRFVLIIGMLLCIPAGAHASLDFDFFGTMPYHNSVLSFDFDVSTSADRTFFSSSWDDGGFDPMLGLWTSSGSLINFQDDGSNVGSTLSNGVSYTHGNWDSYYSVFLDPGSYILTLSAYDNFNVSNTLSDGFALDGAAPIPIASWDQPANGFRTADYAFHILNVDAVEFEAPTAVPEPSTYLLLGMGLGLIALVRRRMA